MWHLRDLPSSARFFKSVLHCRCIVMGSCYKQSTYETCLSVCLLLLVGNRPTQSSELQLWRAGWRFNYLAGQLAKASRQSRCCLVAVVELRRYAASVRRTVGPKVRVTSSRITAGVIERTPLPAIIYLDNYYLEGRVHAPHFVLMLRRTRRHFVIADPWDGRVKRISGRTLSRSVCSLRRRLGFSPVLIKRASTLS